MSDLYDATVLNSKIPGAPQLCISSSLLEMATGRRCLNAALRITVHGSDNDIVTEMSIPLDPSTMRAMARVLYEHASRIADKLMPLVHAARPAPEALSAPLFRAPEAHHVG